MRLNCIIWISIVLSLGLGGCGFKLRGTYLPATLPFKTITIAPDDPFDPVYKQLKHSLQAKKIHVRSQPVLCPNTPGILILNHTFTEQPFVYGSDGEIRREKIIFDMKYQYDYYDNNQLKTRIDTITTRRFWQINLNQNLANLAEKEMIKKEMMRDAVQQLLVQLTAR